MKGKRKFGFDNHDDEQIILRRILLNTLMRGPARVESIVASAAGIMGFPAMRWFGLPDGGTSLRKIERARGGGASRMCSP